ncbi:16S rRNA (cytosine(1402)-N(4))-methyltransferase RsmH [Candidatus Kuenenbacteria bacterium]|nr:16S rRNA (cytosine(1402)-N(4))-methyltransferase RsmH [Candidatus Kuenenbacteria bacterium]
MHLPVLLNEVIENLNIQPNQNFIDCTFGDGGHTAAILKKNGPNGKVLGIEIDLEMAKFSMDSTSSPQAFNFQFSKRLILVKDSFVNLKEIVKRENFGSVSGILLDLGLSSRQLEESKRGFSFQKDEPLDMRFNQEVQSASWRIKFKINLTAQEIINKWPQFKIEKILKEYGEEKFAGKIAKKIIEERKIKQIETTFELKEIIKKATPEWYNYLKIHPATKVFQALRIAVNNELENLKQVLPQAIKILEPKGKICVISFHSLEDRIVKQFFKQESRNCVCPSEFPQCVCQHQASLKIITKKVITPTFEEIKNNPRSRSAKMRIAEKF